LATARWHSAMREPFAKFKRKSGKAPTASTATRRPRQLCRGRLPDLLLATGVRRAVDPALCGDVLSPWLDGGEALLFALTAFGALLLG
jgi:hypothetical protein